MFCTVVVTVINLRVLRMESNKDYQRDDIIFHIVVWVFVIAIVYIDIKVTFNL